MKKSTVSAQTVVLPRQSMATKKNINKLRVALKKLNNSN